MLLQAYKMEFYIVYMLQSILKQKVALAVYSAEHNIPQLTPIQWDLFEKIFAALNPVEEITQSISTEIASVSLIIPFVRTFPKTLENHDNDHGIRTMKKNDMLISLNTRYGDVEIESNEPLVLATLLDPRFKDKFFSATLEKNKAK